MSAYRTPADRPAATLNAAERLAMAGAEVFVGHQGPCPKCQAAHPHPKVASYDAILHHRGCSGRWLLCSLRDLHIHARCGACGARWVMLPGDADFGAEGTKTGH